MAQALYYSKRDRTPTALATLVSKLRVYAIEEQDNTGPWLRENFPELFYISRHHLTLLTNLFQLINNIISPPTNADGTKNNNKGIWMGFSGEIKANQRQFECGADYNLVTSTWVNNNLRINHGVLGGYYPHFVYLMEVCFDLVFFRDD